MSLPKRIVVVGSFGLVALLAIKACSPSASTRYAAAQKRAADECEAFRATAGHRDADVCRADARMPRLQELKDAEASVKEARVAFVHREPARAARALAAATQAARGWDRRGTLGGQLFASKIVGDVTALLDLHGRELDEQTRRDLVAGARLEVATHPFETLRLHRQWVLAHWEELRLPDAPPTDVKRLAEEMERNDEAYTDMTKATLAGDVQRCALAARRLGPLESPEFAAGMCLRLDVLVKNDQQLARM